MGRSKRPAAAGATYHLTARGNGRRDIFVDAADRHVLMRVVDRVSLARGWRHHAWCLMSNHLHLLTTTPKADLSAGMCEILGQYSRSFGRRHGRPGHLFGDRFFSVVVETDRQFLATVRYIARNPVAAGLTDDPTLYPWSHCGRRARTPQLRAFDAGFTLALLHPHVPTARALVDELIRSPRESARVTDPRPAVATLVAALGATGAACAGRQLGYSSSEIGGVLGVTARTVDRWVADVPWR